jgi:serine phosphatase RsbU (regulator of sigma subunit)/coenzyme F420-reducing hydrogenase delta subunit
MGMHKSDELKNVVRILYKEFRNLVTEIDSVNIQLNPDSSKDIHFWTSVEEDIYPELYHLPYVDLPIFENVFNAFNSPGEGFFDYLLNKEEKDAFFREIFKVQPVPPQRKKMIQNAEGMVMVGWFHKHSGIDIVHYNLKRFGEEEKNIVKRFAAAFEQTYIRFLDLQKAEEQARESEIQLGLERVRARTMAMHQSDELAETAAIVFQQMTELGVSPERINICLIKEAENVLEVWATDQQGIKISHHFNASLDEPTTGKPIYDAWKDQKKSIVIDLSGKELNDWIRYVREEMGMTIKDELIKEHRIQSVAFFSQGMILTTTPEPLPEESIKLLERFADVFNLTYRRFLDLQKAETQAREAEIQLALERVRARTMAMHKSDELAETAEVLFQQMTELGVTPERITIGLIKEETKVVEVWSTDQEGLKINHLFNLSLDEPTTGKRIYEAWEKKKKSLIIHLSGQELNDWIRYVREVMGMTIKEELVSVHRIHSVAFFSHGMVLTTTPEPLPEESMNLLERFADVFNLTYRRFLDLKQAEAQAREAIKQASLDRIRGEIASMRTAEDLNRITPIIWRELTTLEVPFIRCGVFIIDEDNAVTHVYLTTPEGKSLGVLNLSTESNALTKNSVEHWKNKQIYKEHWNKEEFINWTKSMMELGQVQNAETYQGSSQPPESLYLHFVPFEQGMLYVGNVDPLDEEKLELTKTLAEAFSIAYARYEDFNRVETTNEELNKLSGELKIKNKELENENERKAIELEEARELQLAMLPKEIPDHPGLDIKVFMQTATEVGGDYYDFSTHIDGSFNIAIGDATGHGMKAGTLVTMMKSLFVANSTGKDIEGYFMSSNEAIKNSNLKRMMAGFAMLNISDHKARYINAGMPSVYHYIKNKKEVNEVKQHNLPLGAMKIGKYRATEINLNKGDVLLLMTDGFPELHNPEEKLLGYEKVYSSFKEVAEKEPEEIIRHLNEEGNRWRKDKELLDDVTFVVIKVK